MIFLLILVHLACPHTGPVLSGRCRGLPLCCAERRTMTALRFIISFFILSQQGLFYKKITFSTHFFRLLIVSLFLFSIILHWFYIKAVNDCSRSVRSGCFYRKSVPNGPSFPVRQGGFPLYRGMWLLTLPVPPWLPARYLPRTGTLRCRCILPHGFQHNAFQNPS